MTQHAQRFSFLVFENIQPQFFFHTLMINLPSFHLFKAVLQDVARHYYLFGCRTCHKAYYTKSFSPSFLTGFKARKRGLLAKMWTYRNIHKIHFKWNQLKKSPKGLTLERLEYCSRMKVESQISYNQCQLYLLELSWFLGCKWRKN